MNKLCLFQRACCGVAATATGNVELERYFPVIPECTDDVPKTHFKLRSGRTLSPRKWRAAFSQDGRLDISSVLRRIQRGGIHPSIKGVVWEFLLGCYDPNSTSAERDELRQHRREQFAALKAECQNMVAVMGSGKYIKDPIVTDDDQPIEDHSTNSAKPLACGSIDKKVFQWKRCLHQIGLDVVRTDRALVFYENEANQAKLWDLLAIYAWMDYDIGYVQGMSDLCSPMVILLENEADAFWCFEHVMRRVRENFRCDTSSIGVQSQLSTLSDIIKVVDPNLHKHIEELDGGEYLFAFRMLMVLFRREFSFVDALYLWEVMWAMEYNPNLYASYMEPSSLNARMTKTVSVKLNKKVLRQYGKFERARMKSGTTDQESALAVFLVASVLETKNKRFMNEAKGLDDVFRILSDLSGNLDAKKALKQALKFHKKYLNKAKKRRKLYISAGIFTRLYG